MIIMISFDSKSRLSESEQWAFSRIGLKSIQHPASLESIETPPGIAMCAEIAPANAKFSIRDSFENLENITDENDGQFQKEFVQMTATETKISIQSKPLGSNVEFSIRDNRESMSNMTDESEMAKEKHFSPITSTEPGM
jgi:hypothetical protein